MITAAEEKLALKLKLEQEAKKTQVELSKLDRLTELYPDLKKHTNRWGTVRYCSPFVNFKVDEVELRYNCGCCGDSPLEAWPYTTTKDGDRVYICDMPSCRAVGQLRIGSTITVALFLWVPGIATS